MNGVLGHDSALVRLYWAGATRANETDFVMNHTPGAGSIARPITSNSARYHYITDVPHSIIISMMS